MPVFRGPADTHCKADGAPGRPSPDSGLGLGQTSVGWGGLRAAVLTHSELLQCLGTVSLLPVATVIALVLDVWESAQLQV